ncbi:MAG: helix-turn-helix domain-containing protein [Oscillospiraceae bacterium]|nr:helix-turn-helix domain-containing protein [Oscillospiraceae bacterium]
MAIYISEKLKQFRKSRDLTQEQIADIFHVSPQAVSRWETGVSFPDIETLPSIAEFFKVTVDDLLGVDVIRNQEKIDEVLTLLKEKHKKGLTDDAIEICRNALKEFPNNYKLLAELAHFLSDKAAATDDDKTKRECQQEAVTINERILETCTDDEIRWEVIQGLALGYSNLGENEKAKETANKLPPFGISRESIHAIICDGEEGLKIRTKIMMWQADSLAFDLAMIGYGNTIKDTQSNIQLVKKAISILEILYENGDYGFYNVRLSDYYGYLARHYMTLKEFDNALDCIEKSANYAIACDTLPEDFIYTSIAVKGSDLGEGTKNYDYNEAYRKLNNLFSIDMFNPIREHERFKAVITELEKYAKKSV